MGTTQSASGVSEEEIDRFTQNMSSSFQEDKKENGSTVVSGWLLRQAGDTGSLRPYWFRKENSFLTGFESESSRHPSLFIPLADFLVVSGSERQFYLCSSSRSYHMIAVDEQEKRKWVSRLAESDFCSTGVVNDTKVTGGLNREETFKELASLVSEGMDANLPQPEISRSRATSFRFPSISLSKHDIEGFVHGSDPSIRSASSSPSPSAGFPMHAGGIGAAAAVLMSNESRRRFSISPSSSGRGSKTSIRSKNRARSKSRLIIATAHHPQLLDEAPPPVFNSLEITDSLEAPFEQISLDLPPVPTVLEKPPPPSIQTGSGFRVVEVDSPLYGSDSSSAIDRLEIRVQEFERAEFYRGLYVWMIDKFDLKCVPEEDYGTFFTGNAYLVFQNLGSENGSGGQYIHYWYGSEAPIDLRVSAAYYASLLLRHCTTAQGGVRVETEDEVSPEFVLYFPRGIQCLPGSTGSGLRNAAPLDESIWLFEVSEDPNTLQPYFEQMDPELRYFNSQCVYVASTPDAIYQWRGVHCTRRMQARAIELASMLRDARPRRPGAVYLPIEAYDESMDGNSIFFSFLGGERSVMDADLSEKSPPTLCLYLVTIDGEDVGIAEVCRDPCALRRSMLSHDQCYLLESPSQLYYWIGKVSPARNREAIHHLVQTFRVHFQMPEWTPVIRESDGGEDLLFRSFFPGWLQEIVRDSRFVPEIVAREGIMMGSSSNLKKSTDVAALARDHSISYMMSNSLSILLEGADLDRQLSCSEEPIIEELKDGLVKETEIDVEIWRIDESGICSIDEECVSVFHSSDCYLVVETKIVSVHPIHSTEEGDVYANCSVFFWKGSDVQSRLILSWKLFLEKVVEERLVEKIGKSPERVELEQGKETDEFLSLFNRRLIVMNGSYKNNIENGVVKRTPLLLSVRLWGNPAAIRTVEVEPVASSLNSGDVFILITENSVFAWIGTGASEAAVMFLSQLPPCILLNREIEQIDEGQETEAFWNALGGRSTYTSIPYLLQSDRVCFARLFQCFAVSGAFQMIDVLSFDHRDLDSKFVYILDAYYEIFLWIGASKLAKTAVSAAHTAISTYLASVDDSRPTPCPITDVFEGHEPPSFRSMFQGWVPREVEETVVLTSTPTFAKNGKKDVQKREATQSALQRALLGAKLGLRNDESDSARGSDSDTSDSSDSDSDNEASRGGKQRWRERIMAQMGFLSSQ